MEKASRLPSARLYAIMAREAPVAVVFRRGPSKWVQLIRWDTSTDTFTPGQWFHGRIYERRCDLSPDGTKLIYFAQKTNARTLADKEYTYAWTAISKPPYLTALALWPKGDCWHGGGLFETNDRVWLNHLPEAATPHPDHNPQGIKVVPNPQAHGEDAPVEWRRLERDGWVRQGEAIWRDLPGGKGLVTDRPGVFEKRSRDGRWILRHFGNVREYAVIDTLSSQSHRVDGAEWADWDQKGRLVFACEGRLFAAEMDDLEALQRRELADFNGSRPEGVAPPEWAKSW